VKRAVIYNLADGSIDGCVSVSRDNDLDLNYDPETQGAIAAEPTHEVWRDPGQWRVENDALVRIPGVPAAKSPIPPDLIGALLDEVNAVRAKVGLEPVAMDELSAKARVKAAPAPDQAGDAVDIPG
jgi:hypothetical protein